MGCKSFRIVWLLRIGHGWRTTFANRSLFLLAATPTQVETAPGTWAGRMTLNLTIAAKVRMQWRRWLRRRRVLRTQLAYEVWNLRERYGPAAGIIARSSARQVGGSQRRRFWLAVAAELRRESVPAQ